MKYTTKTLLVLLLVLCFIGSALSVIAVGGVLTATSGSTDAGTPTGTYTDTHSVNGVFLGGTDPDEISVILWVNISEETGVGGCNYAAYWNSSTSGYIYIYNHDSSDWSLLDDTPNGDNGPLAWDNDTVVNEDYYNSTSVGFKFVATSIIGSGHIYVDYFQIETVQGPDWKENDEASFYFNVPYNMWGYNTALIILGLVMIPVSTIYLAYGAKHDRSSNRLFFGLMLFMLGCGLFIGGVLP